MKIGLNVRYYCHIISSKSKELEKAEGKLWQHFDKILDRLSCGGSYSEDASFSYL